MNALTRALAMPIAIALATGAVQAAPVVPEPEVITAAVEAASPAGTLSISIVEHGTVNGIVAPGELIDVQVTGVDPADALVCLIKQERPPEPYNARRVWHVMDVNPPAVADLDNELYGWTNTDRLHIQFEGKSADEREQDADPYIIPVICVTFNTEGELTGRAAVELATGVFPFERVYIPEVHR